MNDKEYEEYLQKKAQALQRGVIYSPAVHREKKRRRFQFSPAAEWAGIIAAAVIVFGGTYALIRYANSYGIQSPPVQADTVMPFSDKTEFGDNYVIWDAQRQKSDCGDSKTADGITAAWEEYLLQNKDGSGAEEDIKQSDINSIFPSEAKSIFGVEVYLCKSRLFTCYNNETEFIGYCFPEYLALTDTNNDGFPELYYVHCPTSGIFRETVEAYDFKTGTAKRDLYGCYEFISLEIGFGVSADGITLHCKLPVSSSVLERTAFLGTVNYTGNDFVFTGSHKEDTVFQYSDKPVSENGYVLWYPDYKTTASGQIVNEIADFSGLDESEREKITVSDITPAETDCYGYGFYYCSGRVYISDISGLFGFECGDITGCVLTDGNGDGTPELFYTSASYNGTNVKAGVIDLKTHKNSVLFNDSYDFRILMPGKPDNGSIPLYDISVAYLYRDYRKTQISAAVYGKLTYDGEKSVLIKTLPENETESIKVIDINSDYIRWSAPAYKEECGTEAVKRQINKAWADNCRDRTGKDPVKALTDISDLYIITPVEVKEKYGIVLYECDVYLFAIYDGNVYILQGMSAEQCIVTDLSADGIPELCYSFSDGSGVNYQGVGIFDIKTKTCETVLMTANEYYSIMLDAPEDGIPLYGANGNAESPDVFEYGLNRKYLGKIVFSNNKFTLVQPGSAGNNDAESLFAMWMNKATYAVSDGGLTALKAYFSASEYDYDISTLNVTGLSAPEINEKFGVILVETVIKDRKYSQEHKGLYAVKDGTVKLIINEVTENRCGSFALTDLNSDGEYELYYTGYLSYSGVYGWLISACVYDFATDKSYSFTQYSYTSGTLVDSSGNVTEADRIPQAYLDALCFERTGNKMYVHDFSLGSTAFGKDGTVFYQTPSAYAVFTNDIIAFDKTSGEFVSVYVKPEAAE